MGKILAFVFNRLNNPSSTGVCFNGGKQGRQGLMTPQATTVVTKTPLLRNNGKVSQPKSGATFRFTLDGFARKTAVCERICAGVGLPFASIGLPKEELKIHGGRNWVDRNSIPSKSLFRILNQAKSPILRDCAFTPSLVNCSPAANPSVTQ